MWGGLSFVDIGTIVEPRKTVLIFDDWLCVSSICMWSTIGVFRCVPQWVVYKKAIPTLYSFHFPGGLTNNEKQVISLIDEKVDGFPVKIGLSNVPN